MKRTKRPKVCDCCSEDELLNWSKDEEMWICYACENELSEKRSLYEMELKDSYDAMLDDQLDYGNYEDEEFK